jgi:hypothetical protein
MTLPSSSKTGYYCPRKIRMRIVTATSFLGIELEITNIPINKGADKQNVIFIK